MIVKVIVIQSDSESDSKSDHNGNSNGGLGHLELGGAEEPTGPRISLSFSLSKLTDFYRELLLLLCYSQA